MSASPSLRSDARRNRERIVAAAAEAFASDGVDVQMAEIARRAGLGNATVFRHFPTKQDLLFAVVSSTMARLAAEMEATAAEPDDATALRRLVRMLARTMLQNASVKQLSMQHFEGDERLLAHRDHMVATIDGVVRRCQDAGIVRPDVAAIDVVVLVSGVVAALDGLEQAAPGIHERYLQLALNGLRAAAATEPLAAPPPTVDQLDAAMRQQVHSRG